MGTTLTIFKYEGNLQDSNDLIVIEAKTGDILSHKYVFNIFHRHRV